MLEVKNGKIFVEGVETIDDELIGLAFKDFAENLTRKNLECELQLKGDLLDTEYEGVFIYEV